MEKMALCSAALRTGIPVSNEIRSLLKHQGRSHSGAVAKFVSCPWSPFLRNCSPLLCVPQMMSSRLPLTICHNSNLLLGSSILRFVLEASVHLWAWLV